MDENPYETAMPAETDLVSRREMQLEQKIGTWKWRCFGCGTMLLIGGVCFGFAIALVLLLPKTELGF